MIDVTSGIGRHHKRSLHQASTAEKLLYLREFKQAIATASTVPLSAITLVEKAATGGGGRRSVLQDVNTLDVDGIISGEA